MRERSPWPEGGQIQPSGCPRGVASRSPVRSPESAWITATNGAAIGENVVGVTCSVADGCATCVAAGVVAASAAATAIAAPTTELA